MIERQFPSSVRLHATTPSCALVFEGYPNAMIPIKIPDAAVHIKDRPTPFREDAVVIDIVPDEIMGVPRAQCFDDDYIAVLSLGA